MASVGRSVEPLRVSAVTSTQSSRCKIKRTPVILNYPRKPDVAHFRVLQWNVLADGLAQHGDFCRAPPACLEWEYRRPLLLQEILEANADIICLQELNHFDELQQVLGGLGYEGAFREKHASPALKYEYPPDGMAVFFRRSRFRSCAGGVEGRSFLDDSTGREQSQGYLQVLLYDMVIGRQLLIVTTHLKAKDGPECEDVRLQQATQLLRNVEATVKRLQGGGGGGSAAAAAGPSGNGGCSDPGNGHGGAYVGGNGAAAAAAAAFGAVAANGANGNGSGSPGGNGSGGGGGCLTAAAVPVPVVLTGDFNTTPGSKTCEAFRRHPLGLQSLWEQRPLYNTLSSGSASGSDWEAPPLPPPPPLQPCPGTGAPPGDVAAPAAAAAAAAAGPSPAAPSGPEGHHGPPPRESQQMASVPARAIANSSTTAAGDGCRTGSSEFSTWKFRVKGESKRISDYIWFSDVGGGGGGGGGGEGPLRPLQRWRMLTEEEIGPGALPSAAYGSDHVSLCCEFEWDVESDLEWAPAAREADWG